VAISEDIRLHQERENDILQFATCVIESPFFDFLVKLLLELELLLVQTEIFFKFM
jgi:hypothetical protein